VARFLNLAKLDKVPAENLKLVAVIQGPATPSVLTQEAYQARFNRTNDNLALIAALKKAGVQIMVCGQALTGHEFSPGQVYGDVTIAVSALTVLAEYQLDGYALISI
jgi:intracellular sulfur oxidation DsrE/DsrF family protein